METHMAKKYVYNPALNAYLEKGNENFRQTTVRKSSVKRYEYNPKLNAYFEKSETKDFVTARINDHHADLAEHNDRLKKLNSATSPTQREALSNLAYASFNRLMSSHNELRSMGVNVPQPRWHEAFRASFAKSTRRAALREMARAVAIAAGGKAGKTAADVLTDPTLPYTTGNIVNNATKKIDELKRELGKGNINEQLLREARPKTTTSSESRTSRRGLLGKIGAGLAAAGGIAANRVVANVADKVITNPTIQNAVKPITDATTNAVKPITDAAADAIGRLSRSLKHETESAAANPWDLIVNEDGTTISHSVGYDEKGHNGEKSRAKKKNLKKATRRPFGMPGEGRLEKPGDDHDTSDFGRGQLVASQGRPKRRLEKDLAPNDPKPEKDPEGPRAAMHAMRDFRNAELARQRGKEDWRQEAAISLSRMKIPALRTLSEASEARNRAGLEARQGDTKTASFARSMEDNRNEDKRDDDSDEGNELSRDEQNRRDARRKREHVPAHIRDHFEQEDPDNLHRYTTRGGNVMAQKFINGDNDDNVTVTKSQADLSMIAQMMSQTFGITPQRVLDNVSKITKSEANLHAVEHGEIFELHQKPSGEFIVAPIGYGSVGDLALPVPSEYADVFEMDLHKAKIRAHQLQKVEMRKSYVEVDSDFHYRDQIDTLLAKAYKFAKKQVDVDDHVSHVSSRRASGLPGASYEDKEATIRREEDKSKRDAGFWPRGANRRVGAKDPAGDRASIRMPQDDDKRASWGDGEDDDGHKCPKCGGKMGRRGKCNNCGYKQKGYMKAADPDLAGKYNDLSNYFAPQPEGKNSRNAISADFENASGMRGRGPGAQRVIDSDVKNRRRRQDPDEAL